MESLFTVLIPILAGGLTTLLMNWLKSGVALVDKLPAVVKQLIVGAGSWGLVKLSLLLAVSLSTTDVTMLVSSDIMSLVAAGLSFIFYKKPAPTA